MGEMRIHCLYDELAPASQLKPHPQNRNTHPDDQIDRLAKILEFQGWRYPIKVSKRSGFITSGHGRLLAANKNQWERVPVNYQDYDSDEQEYMDVQADNAIASWAELDLSGIHKDLEQIGPFDIDLLGIKDFQFEPVTQVPGADEDEVPEHVEPRTKLGDIYQLGRHRLMCGDSTAIDDVDRLMAGEKSDAAFTSPPYGIGLDYNSYDDSFENTRQVVTDVLTTLATVVDGYISLNWGDIVSGRKINNTEFPSQFSWLPLYDETLRSHGFYLWGQRIWKKPHARVSAPWTASSNRPATDWEYLFTWTNGKHTYSDRDHGSHFGVIDSSESGQTDTLAHHPGAFPVMVAEKMVLIHSAPAAKVIDPFGGTGTTLIACEKTNRRCFMMELDPRYCDVIVARWEKYTGKKAELISG
jgi:DNA modification methylase